MQIYLCELKTFFTCIFCKYYVCLAMDKADFLPFQELILNTGSIKIFRISSLSVCLLGQN